MLPPLSDSERFINRVHRRMLWQSLVDRLGLVVLFASISGIVLLPLDRELISLSSLLIVIACVAIFMMVALAFRAWPTVITAAVAADRQFRLDDLLTTTLKIQPVPFDDLSSVVIAIANARCRHLSALDISLERLGRAAWSGIFFAASGAIVLAVIPLRSLSWNGVQTDAKVLTDTVDPLSDTEQSRSQDSTPSRRSDPVGEGNSTIAASLGEGPGVDPGPRNGTDQNSLTGHDAANAGGGASTTGTQASAQTAEMARANGDPSDPRGITSTGGREADQHKTGTGDEAGTIAGRDVAAIPAWRSTEWTASRAAALTAARAGRIPPLYRDLVREYFQ